MKPQFGIRHLFAAFLVAGMLIQAYEVGQLRRHVAEVHEDHLFSSDLLFRHQAELHVGMKGTNQEVQILTSHWQQMMIAVNQHESILRPCHHEGGGVSFADRFLE